MQVIKSLIFLLNLLSVEVDHHVLVGLLLCHTLSTFRWLIEWCSMRSIKLILVYNPTLLWASLTFFPNLSTVFLASYSLMFSGKWLRNSQNNCIYTQIKLYQKFCESVETVFTFCFHNPLSKKEKKIFRFVIVLWQNQLNMTFGDQWSFW